MRVDLADGSFEGTATDIDPEGHLRAGVRTWWRDVRRHGATRAGVTVAPPGPAPVRCTVTRRRTTGRADRGPPGREAAGPGLRWSAMRLLVTGGAGFIGSNFVRYWVERHPDDAVVAYDVLTYAGNRPNLADVEDRIAFVQGDIGDLDMVPATLADHEIDVIVNFAAESHNSLAILDPTRFFQTNVMGTQTLAEAARATAWPASTTSRPARSTATCRSTPTRSSPRPPPTGPGPPTTPRRPGADHAVRAYDETYGLPATITNCCNNYGPYQFPEKVIPLFTARALDDQPLPLYKSTQNKREWLHVDDHCRAIELVLQHGVVGETYNVGSGVEASIEEIADAVLAATGKPQSLKEIVPDRPSHDRRYLLDSSKIRKELGWEPTVPFEQGLADTVGWYADHRLVGAAARPRPGGGGRLERSGRRRAAR